MACGLLDGLADVGPHIIHQAVQHAPELLNEEDKGLALRSTG